MEKFLVNEYGNKVVKVTSKIEEERLLNLGYREYKPTNKGGKKSGKTKTKSK